MQTAVDDNAHFHCVQASFSCHSFSTWFDLTNPHILNALLLSCFCWSSRLWFLLWILSSYCRRSGTVVVDNCTGTLHCFIHLIAVYTSFVYLIHAQKKYIRCYFCQSNNRFMTAILTGGQNHRVTYTNTISINSGYCYGIRVLVGLR